MNTPEQESAIAAYRQALSLLQEKMQSEYDKAVLALSGGAFGVSVLLIKDIIGTSRAESSVCLNLAWVAWALSITSVLISFYTSANAMEETIRELDTDSAVSAKPGGSFDLFTRVLNICSGGFFVIGIFLFGYFVSANL